MRRLLAGIFACAAALAAPFITLPSGSDVVPIDGSPVSHAAAPLLPSDVASANGSPVSHAAAPSLPSGVAPADGSPGSDAAASSLSAPSPVPACGSEQDARFADDPACTAATTMPDEIAQARAYLVETASPGYTMTLQGPEIAIGRLHPEFAVRLEHAIREARSAGLPFASIFSAYRPPAFGVGGFSDKFYSLHTYGLAVDMRGIGSPGSPEAQLWHQIAARNGVVCPYGPRDRAEWNHCQPTSVKMILAANPLRETVTPTGPSDLESMFEAGDPMIVDMASAAQSLAKASPTPVRALEANAKGPEPTARVAARQRTKREARATAKRVAAKHVSKAERIAAKSAKPAKAERLAAKSAERAKSQRAAAKTAQDARPGQRKGGGRTLGAEESQD